MKVIAHRGHVTKGADLKGHVLLGLRIKRGILNQGVDKDGDVVLDLRLPREHRLVLLLKHLSE